MLQLVHHRDRNGNAGTRYTRFYRTVAELHNLDWQAIGAMDWRDPFVKERKQSEFLIEKSFPWKLVERIGVLDADVAARVSGVLAGIEWSPPVAVMRNWYY